MASVPSCIPSSPRCFHTLLLQAVRVGNTICHDLRRTNLPTSEMDVLLYGDDGKHHMYCSTHNLHASGWSPAQGVSDRCPVRVG